MTKVSILGRGNAGCISALQFNLINRHTSGSNIELELIYDPDIKPVPTGQGTVMSFTQALWENFGTSYTNSFPFTLKSGIMYENWGGVNDKHFHGFPYGQHAVHFQPKDFQDYVCKNLSINFTETQENVVSYDDVDADYIVDCRGRPKDIDPNDYDTLVNPVNCALLGNLPKKHDDVHYTRTIATPDGWCFYIPLPDTTSVGYLFNSNITSEENARNNFNELFGVEGARLFPFSQYIAKEPIIEDLGPRVMLNGNRLFFLEPMEATAMSSYQFVAQCYTSYVMKEGKISKPKWYGERYPNDLLDKTSISNHIRNYIDKVQSFILLHYKDGSKYNTPFWSYAKDLYNQNQSQELNNILSNIDRVSATTKGREEIHRDPFQYAQWKLWSIANWYWGRTRKEIWPNFG